MKRYAAAALGLLILAALALSPYFFGLKTEAIFRDRLAQASTRGQVRFEVAEYERGYASSRVEVVISLDFLAEVANTSLEELKLTRLVFRGTVHHGPLTFLAGSFNGEAAPLLGLGALDGVLGFEQEPVFYQMFFGTKPLLLLRAAITPTGEANLAVRGQELLYKAPDDSLNIDWKGFLARVRMAGERLSGTVEGEGLLAASTIGEFKLSGYRSEFDLSKHDTGYYLGKQSMTMDGVSVQVAGRNLFRAGKLTVGYDSGAQGSLMSFTSAVDFFKFDVGERSFGPMVLNTVGRNIDLNGLKMLEQSYRDALVNTDEGRKPFDEGAPGGPDAQPDSRSAGEEGLRLSDEIIEALKAIAAGAPSIEVPRFSLDSPDGRISGQVRMGVNPEATIDFSSPESIEGAIFMDFGLTVPRKLAVEFLKLNKTADAQKKFLAQNPDRFPSEEELDAFATTLAQRELEAKIRQGYYQPRGQDLYLAGGLKNSVLTINGKRIPL